MVRTIQRFWVVILLVNLLAGCGPKHFGYQLHTNPDQDANDFALLVHAVNDFAVKIHSINGKNTQGVIKTNSHVPTYIELLPGTHQIGVGLEKGYGPCGRVDITAEQPVIMPVELVAGKVYLIQRQSKFNNAILCDQSQNSIQVEFYLSELPALPYTDVRDSFIEVKLNDLTDY